MLLLDPQECLQPYFRSPKGEHRFREHPLLRHILPPTFRGEVFRTAGIKIGEANSNKGFNAPLSDLDATTIQKGKFRLALTTDPSLHLRFDESRNPPTILVPDSRTMCLLALLDLTGLMTYFPTPSTCCMNLTDFI